MYVVFYFQPLPAMLENPFELNRECLPVRDHINDDIENNHRLAKYLTSHNHFVLRIYEKGCESGVYILHRTPRFALICSLFHKIKFKKPNKPVYYDNWHCPGGKLFIFLKYSFLGLVLPYWNP